MYIDDNAPDAYLSIMVVLVVWRSGWEGDSLVSHTYIYIHSYIHTFVNKPTLSNDVGVSFQEIDTFIQPLEVP